MTVKIRMVGVGKKLLGGAVGVMTVVRDIARHAAWYVRYQVDGTAREEERATARDARPRPARVPPCAPWPAACVPAAR